MWIRKILLAPVIFLMIKETVKVDLIVQSCRDLRAEGRRVRNV
jgi:hypothetical protein